MSIYKDCDIRGIYPSEITGKESYLIGRALATKCPGKILAGGDVRLSTPEIKGELIRGLTDSGAEVIDIGTIPTPALYFALKHSDADAGCTVTASHNPPEYNGIKFMIGKTPVTRSVMDGIKDIVDRRAFAENTGSVKNWNVSEDYLSFLNKRFSAKKPLHVLIDAGNGAMSAIAPKAFRDAGYKVTELYCEADGAFPNRSPNPADYTCLKNTGEAVRACEADFGVAFDGDGDRAVFLDEKGMPVQNEKSLVLFIRSLLKDKPTPVVYDQKSSSVIREAILEMGGEPLPERSGHAFIKKRFLENGAQVAGEVSGHFFFGELGYDDGLFAALEMADLIAGSGKQLSELTENIICPPITPDIRIPCPYDQQNDMLAAAEAMAVEKNAAISHLDGVRADFEDCWFLMRKSVTAEQVTLRAEARTEDKLCSLLEEIASVLPGYAREYMF
ncbi:MAG: phosphomannomutase/phosphoglucomutase [Clostridia bacterium]|nr:phosphomannomutase/phosphoglucomutase [Clostridia bacterium]